MSETEDNDLRAAFLGGMSHAACTVNVVTTDGPAGRAGVTVSAMTSVSADTRSRRCWFASITKALQRASSAKTSLLRQRSPRRPVLHRRHLCRPVQGADRRKFDCAKWAVQSTGAPRVVDPLVAFDCRVISDERFGTHHVFIGEVLDIFRRSAVRPHLRQSRLWARRACRAGLVDCGWRPQGRGGAPDRLFSTPSDLICCQRWWPR